KYYWKIIATDNHGASTTGDLWDFNTGSGEEFPKRKLITIDNTRNANTLTDYQVKLDVIYDPEMQPDFDDLRFTDSSDNRLNYWFEDYAPSAHATVWVKIPLIPGSGKTTVYMYYGNPSASSQSNGDATFEFFDDFEDESIDTGKWTTTTTGFGAFVTENSGEINIHTDAISNTTADLISQNSYGPDVAIMFRASISAGQWSDHKGLGFLSTNVGNDWDQTGDSVHWRGQDDDLYASNKYSGSCTNAFIEDGYFSGYRTWEIAWLSSEIRYYADGIFKATHTTNVPSVSITPRFSLKTYTTAPANPLDVFVDYVYVRKYAEPEPTITVEGTSLVAEWHFDEGSGSTVKDSSGNGNDGIIHGATWVDGIKGKALKFDGKDDHVEVQDSSSLRITGNLNVEAWVKVEELGSKYHFIVSKHYTPAGYTLYINPANKFAFEISSQHSVASTTKPELGKWYHVVGTYDQSQLKIYVNDVLENTKSCTAKLATNNQKLRIGQWSAGGYCFKGIIDEVSIYANA
ncbi:MAG: DUF2341 domain-containing protein, partial [Patescibacteria group bacterium]|nr:DUF2341 domain-containing protein [Patescibacteria group bacterium]